MPKSTQSPTDRYLKATYVFILSMALTFGATYFASLSSRMENRGRFERGAISMVNGLKERMTVYTNALMYTRNLFDVKPDLSRQEFTQFVQGMRLQHYFPGIQTMGYVERLDRLKAEKKLRELGLTMADAQAASGSNELDLVVYFERLQNGNSTVHGLDLGTSSERKAAMNAARDTGKMVATDRVRPMGAGASDKGYAFLVFLPRYQRGADLSTEENRRTALLGFVYAGFRAENLFAKFTTDSRLHNANFSMRVYDGATRDLDKVMYTDGNFNSVDPDLTTFFEIEEAAHTWTVEVAAPKGYGLKYLRWSPYLVLLLGTLFSFTVMISLLRSDRLAKHLKIAREEAEEANQAKSMFLANISHEIRTPLGIVAGFSESALTEPDKEKRDFYLKTIFKNASELTRIIGDVLDLSRIEANTLAVENHVFSLKELNDEIRQIWDVEAKNKKIEFRFKRLDELPEYISSDKTRIKQILNNLLSNAFKFTHEGSIQITLEKGPGGQSAIYTIDDTGIGVREENRSKLFRPFSQEDSSITRKFGGSGLGLAISKELALALGGNIKMSSNPNGKGSRFVFEMPLVEASPVNASVDSMEDEISSIRGRKFLLVEDSMDNQLLIRLILEKFGVNLSIANNGLEGVEKVQEGDFDLILMDIQMPVLDGYAAFERLKESGNQVPVVALTAHALKHEKEKALAMGFSAYLTKPIDRAQLINVSSSLLQ